MKCVCESWLMIADLKIVNKMKPAAVSQSHILCWRDLTDLILDFIWIIVCYHSHQLVAWMWWVRSMVLGREGLREVIVSLLWYSAAFPVAGAGLPVIILMMRSAVMEDSVISPPEQEEMCWWWVIRWGQWMTDAPVFHPQSTILHQDMFRGRRAWSTIGDLSTPTWELVTGCSDSRILFRLSGTVVNIIRKFWKTNMLHLINDVY